MVVKALVFIVGLSNVFAGAVVLLAPRWFFDNIGNFPPFSRHYLGDAGAYILPLGIALLIAARDPLKYRSLIYLGAGAGLLHFLNHVYGSVTAHESWAVAGAVGIQAVAMIYAAIVVRPARLPS